MTRALSMAGLVSLALTPPGTALAAPQPVEVNNTDADPAKVRITNKTVPVSVIGVPVVRVEGTPAVGIEGGVSGQMTVAATQPCLCRAR